MKEIGVGKRSKNEVGQVLVLEQWVQGYYDVTTLNQLKNEKPTELMELDTLGTYARKELFQASLYGNFL